MAAVGTGHAIDVLYVEWLYYCQSFHIFNSVAIFNLFVPGTCDTSDTILKGISLCVVLCCCFFVFLNKRSVVLKMYYEGACQGLDHSYVYFINHLEGYILLPVYKIDLPCIYTKWPFYHKKL